MIEVISFKNSDQEPEPDSKDVKHEEESKIIEANVTLTNSTVNVTKVNCLTDKIYGPVEVNTIKSLKLLNVRCKRTNNKY